jgi:hypothetical protein
MFGHWPKRRGGLGGVNLSLESTILALQPYSFVESDYYALDGISGKVSAFIDKVAAGTGIRAITANHAMVQATAANQCVQPAASASFGNRVVASAPAGSTVEYFSNSTAAAWRLLHNGTGVTLYFCSKDNASGAGQYLANSYSAPQQCGLRVGTGGIIFSPLFAANVNVGDPGNPAIGTNAVVIKRESKTGLVPFENTARVALGAISGANFTGAPVNVDAAVLSILGGVSVGVLDGLWASMLVFDRIPTAAEDAIVRAFYSAKYGVV